MKKQLAYIFLRITGFSVLTTFILTAILQANNESAKRARCYMPLFTELLLSFSVLCICLLTLGIFLNNNSRFRSNRVCVFLSFTLLPFGVILLFTYLFITEDGSLTLFGFLHLLATSVPVCSLILWEYYKFNKSLRDGS
ncbi:hypothetical protein [Sphingobacterium sp. DR205]|uniref:hypothetical protein n=1 Tax=Sphingobacterium sp. DR205 TaxID=2713573 RepID=UPI0013E4EB69|nr:hypothetical protein [Sphingobacterium sp. DR205]QIH34966.1 hypothetical protein G6053_19610 [Sphingobacterium sp. DR205]